MANSPNRFTITTDADTMALLRRIEDISSMSPGAFGAKLLAAHLEELWAYVEWYDGLPNDEGSKAIQHRAKHLPQNYGPGTLIDDIKQIDPSYKTAGEKFAEQVAAPRKGEAK